MTSEEFKNKLQYKSIISENSIFNVKTEISEVHCLVDNKTHRLLAFSKYNNTILCLNEYVENSYSRHSINKITDLKNFDMYSNKPYLTTIYRGAIKQDEDNFTYDELYNFHLIIEKAAIIDYLNFRINVHRRSVLNGLFLQETIYNFKQQEAEKILNSNENIDEINYPFLREYADSKNIDLLTAAKEVLIQTKLYKTRLNNTEVMRLKYKNLLKNCKDITKLYPIVNSFARESLIYAKV
jgi:hypothetical protein